MFPLGAVAAPYWPYLPGTTWSFRVAPLRISWLLLSLGSCLHACSAAALKSSFDPTRDASLRLVGRRPTR